MIRFPPQPKTWSIFGGETSGGHEATDTGLAYAPMSQAHGHNHIIQCFPRCTAAQTSSVPPQVIADCALALVIPYIEVSSHPPPSHSAG